MRSAMVALYGRLLDGAVHPFDLAVGPRVPRLGESMFDIEVGAGCFEGMAAEGQFLFPHFLDVLWRPAIAGRIGEVRPVVGEHGVDPVRHGGGEVTQEVTGDPAGLCDSGANRCHSLIRFERQLRALLHHSLVDGGRHVADAANGFADPRLMAAMGDVAAWRLPGDKIPVFAIHGRSAVGRAGPTLAAPAIGLSGQLDAQI